MPFSRRLPMRGLKRSGSRLGMQTVSRMAGEIKNPQSRILIAERGHGVGMFEGAGGGAFLEKIMKEIDALLQAKTSSGGPSGIPASP